MDKIARMTVIRTVVGVDPGYSGAIAALGRGAPAVYRMPLLKQRKHAYHVVAICNILCQYGTAEMIQAAGPPPLLVIERVTRPSSLTRCMGLMEGLGEALGYDVVTVRPQEWKAYFGLGPAKTDSIALALKRWPSLRRTITKRGDDGLAEAALLALWGRENL